MKSCAVISTARQNLTEVTKILKNLNIEQLPGKWFLNTTTFLSHVLVMNTFSRLSWYRKGQRYQQYNALDKPTYKKLDQQSYKLDQRNHHGRQISLRKSAPPLRPNEFPRSEY